MRRILAVSIACLQSLYYSQAGGTSIRQRSLILDGQPIIDDSAHPYFAHSHGNVLCGASLIHPYFLLTAAHCVHSAFQNGDIVNIRGAGPERSRSIQRQIPHPRFRAQVRAYDAALIQLKTPIYSVPYVRLRRDPVQDGNFTVIGMGQQQRQRVSAQLLNANVTLIHHEECQEAYKLNNPILESVMCTTSGACHGDSGGPLLSSEQEQVGIVSFSRSCNETGVYTRVSTIYNWIHDTVCLLSNVPLLGHTCPPRTALSIDNPAGGRWTLQGETDYFQGPKRNSMGMKWEALVNHGRYRWSVLPVGEEISLRDDSRNVTLITTPSNSTEAIVYDLVLGDGDIQSTSEADANTRVSADLLSGNHIIAVAIDFDDHPEEVRWHVMDSNRAVVAAANSTSILHHKGGVLVQEVQGLSSGNYTLVVQDSFGDGMEAGSSIQVNQYLNDSKGKPVHVNLAERNGDTYATRIGIPFTIHDSSVHPHEGICNDSSFLPECWYKLPVAQLNSDANMKVNCMAPFIEPTSRQCTCEVVVDITDRCSSCIILQSDDETDGLWDYAYDCSNLEDENMSCSARDVYGNCIRSESSESRMKTLPSIVSSSSARYVPPLLIPLSMLLLGN